MLIVDMHLVFLQGTTLFGFIFATMNTAMVQNDAYIVDTYLVQLHAITLFGFILATILINDKARSHQIRTKKFQETRNW